MTYQIKSDVLKILREAEVDTIGNTVRLTCGMLEDRKLYNRVDDVLSRLGGKWKTRANGHVFRYDPSLNLAAVLAVGIAPEKNPLSYFPTPDDFIEEMFLFIGDLTDWHLKNVGGYILEPSAGSGAIAMKLRERYPLATIHCIELDPINRAALEAHEFEVVGHDFMEYEPAVEYELVVMNPPFNGTEYIDHIDRAFGMLCRVGEMVAVTPHGWLYGSSKKDDRMVELVSKHGYYEIKKAGRFKSSGTNFATCIVRLCAVGFNESTVESRFYSLTVYINCEKWFNVGLRQMVESYKERYQMDLFGRPCGEGLVRVMRFFEQSSVELRKLGLDVIWMGDMQEHILAHFQELVKELSE